MLLIAIAVTAHADNSLKSYEYWIDSDYSKRTVSNSSQENISFNIDLSNQEQGIHILNFRARNTENVWGSLKRILYYIPQVSSPNIALTGYEYWMDNDVNSRVRVQSSSGTQAFNFDISQYSQGIHFFNFRAYNSDGNMGAAKRVLFYIPEIVNENATVARYEY